MTRVLCMVLVPCAHHPGQGSLCVSDSTLVPPPHPRTLDHYMAIEVKLLLYRHQHHPGHTKTSIACGGGTGAMLECTRMITLLLVCLLYSSLCSFCCLVLSARLNLSRPSLACSRTLLAAGLHTASGGPHESQSHRRQVLLLLWSYSMNAAFHNRPPPEIECGVSQPAPY